MSKINRAEAEIMANSVQVFLTVCVTCSAEINLPLYSKTMQVKTHQGHTPSYDFPICENL